MKYKAYAKVNLILKVVNRLGNGYHKLQMLNTKIDLFDEIEIIKKTEGVDRLYFLNSTLNSTDDNLVLKVLIKIKEEFNITDSFDIYIKKAIPVGAGLGGGSCDAGCVVKAILDIYNIDIDFNRLCEILVPFGADIPYALTNKMAFVEGIGEKVTFIDYLNIDEFVIVNPNIFISTKDIFANNKDFSKEEKIDEIIKTVEEKNYFAFYNELEKPAFKCCNELEDVKNNLSKIGSTVMSGSGSTFMVFGNDVDYIYNECKKIYKEYFIRKVKVIKE